MSQNMIYQRTLLRDDIVLDSAANFRRFIEEEHVMVMRELADRKNLHFLESDVTHDWLDLDDEKAMRLAYESGEFDITKGAPYPGYKWRVLSKAPYVMKVVQTRSEIMDSLMGFYV